MSALLPPPVFRIQKVTLSVQPGSEVRRSSNVTLRCQAKVTLLHPELPLRRDYVMYKDEQVVYRKATSSAEDFVYPLPDARVSNTGKYRCGIQIQDQQTNSDTQRLTVTGGFFFLPSAQGGLQRAVNFLFLQACRCPSSTSTRPPSRRARSSRPPARLRERRAPSTSTSSTAPWSSSRSGWAPIGWRPSSG